MVLELAWVSRPSVPALANLSLVIEGVHAGWEGNSTGGFTRSPDGKSVQARGTSPLRVEVWSGDAARPLYQTNDTTRPPSHYFATDTGWAGEVTFSLAVSYFATPRPPANFTYFDSSTWPATGTKPEQPTAAGTPAGDESDPPPAQPPTTKDSTPMDSVTHDPGEGVPASAANDLRVNAADAKMAPVWWLFLPFSWLISYWARLSATHKLLWGFALAFTRLARDQLLAHPRRAALEALVQANPGITPAEARRRLDWGKGAFNHHLRILRRQRMIRELREGPIVRLVVPGMPYVAPTQTLRNRFLELVRDRPGLCQVDAARALGVAERTLGYHVVWLARQGRVLYRRDGRSVSYFPAPPPRIPRRA